MASEKKNEELAKYIIDRHDRLYEDQSTFRSNWQEIADYIHPTRSNIVSFRQPGAKQTNLMLDSTAIHSNELLAASMNGSLSSPNFKWFSLKVRNVRESKSIAEWLEESATRMHIALQQSNFNSEIHECYLDLGSFGTCAIDIMENKIVAPGFNGLLFKAYAIGEYVVDEDASGKVDTVIRKFKLSTRAAVDEFGSLLNEDTLELVKTKPEEPFEMLRAIVPVANIRHIIGNILKVFPVAAIYVDLKKKDIIRINGFRENPVPVARWAKTSGEFYGRGPGFTAIPHVKTLNKVVELELQAMAKAINPPVAVLDDGIIGSVKLNPAGITYVRREKAITPIQFGADFKASQINSSDLRQAIRRIFFSDQLQLQEGPQMTAAEVYVRYELMQRLLGPTMGRLQSELFNPTIERVFGLMYRAGALPPEPPELHQRYRTLDIEYEGPMARAQRSGEAVAIMRTLQTTAMMGEIKPGAWDHFDEDKIVPALAEINGMPAALLRDKDAILKIRDARAKMEQANQERQDLRDIAEGAKGVAPLIKAAQQSKEKVA